MAHFTGSLAWLGVSDDPAFLGEPETDGFAERWIRTLKEQCLWVQLHDTVEELRQAVAGFVKDYNRSWLIQRHGHQTRRGLSGSSSGSSGMIKLTPQLSKKPGAVHGLLGVTTTAYPAFGECR